MGAAQRVKATAVGTVAVEVTTSAPTRLDGGDCERGDPEILAPAPAPPESPLGVGAIIVEASTTTDTITTTITGKEGAASPWMLMSTVMLKKATAGLTTEAPESRPDPTNLRLRLLLEVSLLHPYLPNPPLSKSTTEQSLRQWKKSSPSTESRTQKVSPLRRVLLAINHSRN